MRQFAVAVGALVFGGSVGAAEPVKVLADKAPITTSRAGFYLGPSAGWVRGSSKGDYAGEVNPPPPPVVYYPFDLKLSSAAIGGLIGYDFQRARWRYGIESDFSWIVNARDRAWDPAGSGRYDQIELLWTAHVRGRIGYLFNQYLVYVSGGAAFAGTRNFHYALDPLYGDSRMRAGLSLGGGIEAALSTQWLLHGEYLHDRFGNQYFGWTSTRYSNSNLTLDTFRMVIAFRPGG